MPNSELQKLCARVHKGGHVGRRNNDDHPMDTIDSTNGDAQLVAKQT